MIRIIGTRLIVPRGDTGSFTLPTKGFPNEEDKAVFSVRDPLTRTTVIEKVLDASQPHLYIFLEHEDTCELEAKDYLWDITLYRNPQYDIETGEIIGGTEVETYYSGYKNPIFSLKESVNDI